MKQSTGNYDGFIDQLEQTVPLKGQTAKGPLLAFGVYAVVLVLTFLQLSLSGGFRSNFLSQLYEYPGFLLQFLSALICLGVSTFYFLKSILNWSHSDQMKYLVISGTSFIMAMALLVWSLFTPVMPSSMLGKRPLCVYETMVFSVIPFGMLLHLAKNRILEHPFTVGGLISLSSVMGPALGMYAACMYDPLHILKYHFSPVLVMAIPYSLIVYLVYHMRRKAMKRTKLLIQETVKSKQQRFCTEGHLSAKSEEYKQIEAWARLMQITIDEKHRKFPSDKAFEKAGLLDGYDIVVYEYLDFGLYGQAFEHLLYMLYESEIEIDKEVKNSINLFGKQNQFANPYDDSF